jgi:hypothetical protein
MQFCSVVSAESGEDPIGSSWHMERFVLVELPLPWKYNALESIHAPERLGALLLELWDLGHRWGFIGFAPDEEYSVAGMTRVIDYQLPPVPFAGYDRTEYLFPTERAVERLRLMATDPTSAELAACRVDAAPASRDVFVCTHGAIDACCATFGYPIYKLLRHMARNPGHGVRVWRCTHFGGHRFAATVLDMPEGRYWGHLDARDLGPFLRRDRPFADLRHRYRGWAALPDPLQQVAEGAAFLRAGWEWTRCLVRSSDPSGADAEHIVYFDYRHPDTLEQGMVEVGIVPSGTVTTMEASNSGEMHEAPQYRTSIRSFTPEDGLLA